jgi:hypothetical protein
MGCKSWVFCLCVWYTAATTNQIGSSIVGIEDPYAQTIQIIKNMEIASHALGTGL